MRAVTALISAVTAAVVTAAVSQMAGAVTTTKKAENPAAWDVVLILTDDQPTGTLPSMPNVTRLLAGRGVDFTNAIVPTSLCCPSRTSLLTGQLATKTGIYSNESDTGYGGYPALRAAGLEKQTIATALDEAGYNTAYFGKYLNEYGPLYDGVAPPGWDTWRVFTTKQSGRYRNFALADAVPFGQTPRAARQEFVRQYSTTHLGRLAADHIRTTPRDQPSFTVFAPYAPHSPFTAEKKYRGSSRLPANYLNPSVLERDVSDKPLYVQEQPDLPTVEGEIPGVNLTRQVDTLRSVDDQVKNLYEAVKARGRLDRTLFVYLSDNGYMHGEHRLDGKGYPYLKSTNVPLVMRWGIGTRGAIDDRLTIANVDVAATILESASLPNTTAGTSVRAPRNADGVLMVGAESTSRVVRPPFCAWRTREELFVRYGSTEEEFYDYRVDPYELENRVADPAYSTRVEQLRDLARQSCTPTPPGFGPTFDLPRWHPARGGTVPVPPDPGTDRVSRA
ncbi:MAG: sulfatase-like hydrolase/transferase [Actinobacteria bacterium]|jgi:arylsulfatase A-like enzyme|nr:sulfatase-like hydrolase/transferase [Actinomycetota bacterium]MCO5300694.1 sulfatase-like hydrolase/transferase [Candidatus Nanopelagicales bacterium]MCB9427291.1 sulfatase-like hydrolase/transferase [Actinomycetota bacterium]HPE11138.1 sulfatase-like hydrolase/transferase [Actinomycetota bacterium]HPJ18366.1 sulfatase-like hydrolase/transferase [Actinomycetota bacterium]